MKRTSILVLVAALWVLAACQSRELYNPDILPADYDYAAGAYPNPVTLNGVTVRINKARVVNPDQNLKPGYIYVVVDVNVSNQSGTSVNATEFRLIDEYLNLYESWQTSVPFGRDLTAMSEVIGPDRSSEGAQVFLIPASALQANLRLRWQSAGHQSRVDLALGSLALP